MTRIKAKRPSNLKHMEAAIAVAETLSFSRAAKRLHISQPAVTKYIRELEESLGALLFIRAHHTVSLTEAGRAYVEEARIVILHAGRALELDHLSRRRWLLRMKTQLISRVDNPSPAISELFRTFMRRLKHMRFDSQMSLPLSR